MPAAQKDVIYIDVDDEITAVIEKVQSSAGKIVALVLPKRASVFQSTVNMRLLKRSADTAKKNLVLITSEASLLPLAGIVGLHVAKTLQSKPAIPAAPASNDTPVAVDDSDVLEAATAATAIAAVATLKPDDEETIEVDNDALEAASAATGKEPKKSLNKKLKVPNFDSFRKKLFLGIGIFLGLVVLWVFVAIILPKATITIKTDTTDVSSSIVVTSSPTIKEVNSETKSIPGILKELKKTDAQKAPATGQKDMGTKATGTVTFTSKTTCSPGFSIPSGTVVSSGSFSFVTQSAATLSPVDVDAGKCVFSSAPVDVVAQNAGDSYNLSARDYAVTGFSSATAKGSAMSGGVSKIVKVVSQQDIDTLRQKIVDGLNGSANQEVTAQLKDEGYFPLTETFAAKDPLVVSSPAVDAEAAEVTVNVTISYTMSGAKQDALTQILEEDIKRQIDTTKQNILDNGLGQATVRIEENKPDGTVRFTLQTTAKAGVEQNESDIKAAIKGKKKGEAKSIIQSRPGVRDVTIETSPFWVSKVPKKDNKITLIFEQQ